MKLQKMKIIWSNYSEKREKYQSLSTLIYINIYNNYVSLEETSCMI